MADIYTSVAEGFGHGKWRHLKEKGVRFIPDAF
jgi:hypothetical protein